MSTPGAGMQRLLVQTQLSNYTPGGKFILECDSGWQMVMGRVREMLRLNPNLSIDVMGPLAALGSSSENQCVTHPFDVNPDLWGKHSCMLGGDDRLSYLEHRILPNALATRYDFSWEPLSRALHLQQQRSGAGPRWDAVYVNDPMHLRNLRAMFHVVGGYTPRFIVHSHFIDTPGCPKFPQEASLWWGQCEAALRADHNFWQCESSMKEFMAEMIGWYSPGVVDDVRSRSTPWDDGYSLEEITSPIDESKVRFTGEEWRSRVGGKVVLFLPNRISPSSGDYTNGMRFVQDILPALRQRTQDFVLVCGNPNQKLTNQELERMCGQHGYVSLVPDSLNRDEFKYVARHAQVALGLYNRDAYGGTAARECVELGCLPLWLDCNEYSSIAREAGGGYPFLVRPDLSDAVDRLEHAIGVLRGGDARGAARWVNRIRDVVRSRCSYEATTPAAMRCMGLLPGA